MDVELFNYELPPELIAQTPAARREESRLLVVDRRAGTFSHHIFAELPDLIPAGTRLFRNDAAVLQARLAGTRETGGKVECLLLRPGESPTRWWCLLKPGKKAASGTFGVPGVYCARVIAKEECEEGGGEYLVEFEMPDGKSVLDVAAEIGKLPLPPYIERSRPQGKDFSALDRERYQTVYARREEPVAAAAPTAGLHFSDELLEKLRGNGTRMFDLTLHVGLGTFQPIKSSTVEAHSIHKEFYTIPAGTRAELERVDSASPRLAVGTTSLRAMEDFTRRLAANDPLIPPSGAVAATAGIYIYPPSKILSADMMITNFHLPKSTLMCLVSSFLTPGE
ncbi:MAG: tRNA preQ1(34) S-adenosylmethionine ribosyltransferase-isomerase QueA, partial [Opitutales bacterium]|nr:tRNA preQ1(34) S-adenosylmethionine ribosyltransferase-isomerase QueA [Opitutales bacterium]